MLARSAPHWTRILRDTTMGRYLFQHEYAFIGRWLRTSTQPRRILDIACGSGSISLPLHGSGLNVVGIDRDALALAEVQRRSNKIPLVLADSLRLPFSDNSFDCAIAIQCFEYFADYHGFLREMSRLLVNGGLLIFDSLNTRSYRWRLKMLFGRTLSYPSPNLSCGQILRATAEHGFNIRGLSGYNWVPFTRDSNSPLVPLAALIEKKLRLDRCSSISPKILVAATKSELSASAMVPGSRTEAQPPMQPLAPVRKAG